MRLAICIAGLLALIAPAFGEGWSERAEGIEWEPKPTPAFPVKPWAPEVKRTQAPIPLTPINAQPAVWYPNGRPTPPPTRRHKLHWVATPPFDYDHPYRGVATVLRYPDEATLREACGWYDPNRLAIGCAAPMGDTCTIRIIADDALADYGVSYDQVYNHEIAHCNGWPADHPRAGSAPASAGR